MQIGQRLLVIEPSEFGHKAFDEPKHALGAIDEAALYFARICVLLAIASLIEQAFGAGGLFRRRQVEEGQEIARTRNARLPARIAARRSTSTRPTPHPENSLPGISLRDDAAPRRRQPSPNPSRRNALFSRPATATSSAGTAESRSGPRNFAVRWNEPSLLRTMPSSTRAAQGRKSASCVVERRYSARFIMVLQTPEIAGDAKMPAHHVDELRIALGGPHRGGLTDHPQQEIRRAIAADQGRAPPPACR